MGGLAAAPTGPRHGKVCAFCRAAGKAMGSHSIGTCYKLADEFKKAHDADPEQGVKLLTKWVQAQQDLADSQHLASIPAEVSATSLALSLATKLMAGKRRGNTSTRKSNVNPDPAIQA